MRVQNELKMVLGGPQRSSELVSGNAQGIPRDPMGAKVCPQAPLGSHSEASGSIPELEKPRFSFRKHLLFTTLHISEPEDFWPASGRSRAPPGEPLGTGRTPQPPPA